MTVVNKRGVSRALHCFIYSIILSVFHLTLWPLSCNFLVVRTLFASDLTYEHFLVTACYFLVESTLCKWSDVWTLSCHFPVVWTLCKWSDVWTLFCNFPVLWTLYKWSDVWIIFCNFPVVWTLCKLSDVWIISYNFPVVWTLCKWSDVWTLSCKWSAYELSFTFTPVSCSAVWTLL